MSGKRAGRFITFEGGEGAGKSTQARLLAAFLRSRGLDTLETREPGGAPGADLIRGMLLGNAQARWDPLSEALLMSAARREHLVSAVWPALDEGKIVVCDRFADSTLAYQGYGLGLDRTAVAQLTALVAQGFAPDLTFVLDQSAESGLLRAQSRGEAATRYERMDMTFHERVRQGFLSIAKSEPQRCVVLDATLPIDAIAATVARMAEERLGFPPP